jgi:tetratricopeptide (TPR) repeat protein
MRSRILAIGLFPVLAGFSAQPPNGADLYRSGDYRQAAAVLEKELKSDQRTSETRFWLGYTYLALSARDKAVEQFEAYLKEKPSDEDVLYALARTYAQLAEMSLQQIFRLNPDSARAYQMRGIRFELESSWLEAIEQYAKAAKLDPNLPGIYASIGRIQEKELKSREAASSAYAEELRRFPVSREANEFFARTAGKPEAVKILNSCYPEARVTCPAPAQSNALQWITFLLAQNRPAEALPVLLQWRARSPSDTDAYYLLGETFTDLKVGTIRRLKSANSQSFRLHQLLAESYASTHRKADAIREYREALALAPKAPALNYELARLLADTEPEAAVKHLLAELQIDQSHYLAKNLLGRLYVLLQKPEAAIPMLQQAIEARPDMIDARKALGQAFAATGLHEKALSEYEYVARIDPRDEQVHFLRAQALSALGRPEEAAEARKQHAAVLKEIRDAARRD